MRLDFGLFSSSTKIYLFGIGNLVEDLLTPLFFLSSNASWCLWFRKHTSGIFLWKWPGRSLNGFTFSPHFQDFLDSMKTYRDLCTMHSILWFLPYHSLYFQYLRKEEVLQGAACAKTAKHCLTQQWSKSGIPGCQTHDKRRTRINPRLV